MVRRIALVFALLAFAAGVLPVTVLTLSAWPRVLPAWHAALFDLCTLLLIAAVLVADRRVTGVLERRERGNEGERLVGGILDRLSAEGWVALHDIDTGRGNVDHVAIGPGGLFTVETKSHRGRVRVASVSPRWLRQAYAQARHVERLVGAKVECLLVFSDAYLDRAPSRQRGVVLLPGRMLTGYLRRRGAVLGVEDARTLHAQLVDRLDHRGC